MLMPRSTSFMAAVAVALLATSCIESEPPQESVSPLPAVAPKPKQVRRPAPPQVPSLAPNKRAEITVEAGMLDRQDYPIRVSLAPLGKDEMYVVREPRGAVVASQTAPDGTLTFPVRSLKAKAKALFLIEKGKAAKSEKGGVVAVQGPSSVSVTVNGKPLLNYQTTPKPTRDGVAPEYWRNGYIHPIYSPAGVVVTEDYPSDKPFQHGLWSSWQSVKFASDRLNFLDPGLKQGRISMESVSGLWGGTTWGGFTGRQYFTNLLSGNGESVLHETWTVVASRPQGQPYYLVDLKSATETLADQQVMLDKNPLGGILLRGSREWQGKGNSTFLSSEGGDRSAAQGAAARWCYLGASRGKLAGVAILAHPANFQQPQALYIDPEDPVFGFAPTKDHALTIDPSQPPLLLQYRLVVLDGKPDAKLIERIWRDYANPPAVSVRLLEKTGK